MEKTSERQSSERANNKIESEMLFEFDEWGLNGKWLKLSTEDGKTVEGAYYQSADSKEIIIFHPGLPGDTVGRFEEEFVAPLLDQGYDVFVARHNGLKNEGNDNLFHNKQRIEKKDGISGQALDWFSEPQVSISYFSQQSKPITLITHSFAGTAGANSFVEMSKCGTDHNPAQKVKKWILASSPIWDVEDDMLDPGRNLGIDDLKKVCQFFAQKYDMPEDGGSDEFARKTVDVLRSIDSQISSSMPETMEIIGLYSESDKIVSPEIGKNFFSKLPRGVLLQDKYLPEDATEDAHDLKHVRVEDLLRIIRMKTFKSKHTFNINK
jgi:hypothetical protein